MVHTTCAVINCISSSRIHKVLKFHQFPHTEERCNIWIEQCGRSDLIGRSVPELKNIYTNQTKPKVKELEGSDVEVCRICLASDVKMYLLKKLTQGLDSLANLLFTTPGLPKYICYQCAPSLTQFNKFMQKSRIAETTLLEIINKTGKLTKSFVKEKNRYELNLESSLSTVFNMRMEAGTDTDILSDRGNIDRCLHRDVKIKPDTIKTVQQNGFEPLRFENIEIKTEIKSECFDIEFETEPPPPQDNDELLMKFEEDEEHIEKNNECLNNKNKSDSEVTVNVYEAKDTEMEFPIKEIALDNTVTIKISFEPQQTTKGYKRPRALISQEQSKQKVKKRKDIIEIGRDGTDLCACIEESRLDIGEGPSGL